MAENECTPPCGNDPVQFPWVLPATGGGLPGEDGPGCLPPMQFCQTTTSTAPVDYPGRVYDITLPINPGFAVETLQVDQVMSPANILWDVSDQDGERFRAELTAFLEGRLPAAATVTITNPNAGQGQVCGAAQAMQIHIECLRLDQNPPNLIELIYDAGQDLILNPAYNEAPPLNPPVAQGDYGYRLLSRQDDPGPFPGNPPANDALCTSTVNRGWETNDVGRTFEIWGRNVAQGVTPTPRGTPVQEITSDGPPPGGRSTIWQTFSAPFSGDFNIRVVHGARDAGENHIITLDNGDTNDQQNGDLINDVTNNVGVVTSGNGPWTTFNQSIPLTAGGVYTLALSTNNPAGGARGGLFTDMRAFISSPGERATAVVDDDTCSVEVNETTTDTTCSFWQPTCENGTITSWTNVATGVELTNAAFWAQVPTPSCCMPGSDDGTGGGGGVALGNLTFAHEACTLVGGVATTVIRTVITDQSGGILSQQFIGPNGAPITPAGGWTPGSCDLTAGTANIVSTCDDLGTPAWIGGSILPNTTFDDSEANQTTQGPGWSTDLGVTDDGGGHTVQQGQLAVVEIEPGELAIRATPNVIGENAVGWQNLELEANQQYRLQFRLNAMGPGAVQWFVNDTPVGDPISITSGTQQFEYFYTHGTTDISSLELRLVSGASEVIVSLDGVMFQRYVAADPDVTTPVAYTGTQRVVIEQILKTSGCADSVRDGLLKDIVDILGGPDSELRSVIGTVEPGCANGVPVTRTTTVRYTNDGQFDSSDTGFSFSDGTFTTVMPPGFTLGACPPPAAIELASTVVATGELGCADGVPYVMTTTQAVDLDGNSIGEPIVSWINSAGVPTGVAPVNFTLGPCPSVCCPTVLGDVCWNDGADSGRAFAIMLGNGMIQYIDQAGAGDINEAFIIECPDSVAISSAQAAVTRSESTGATVVAANAASVTITNVGAANGQVAGAPIYPGETVTINAYYDPVARVFNRVPTINIDGTGTTLHVIRQA